MKSEEDAGPEVASRITVFFSEMTTISLIMGPWPDGVVGVADLDSPSNEDLMGVSGPVLLGASESTAAIMGALTAGAQTLLG